MKKFLYSPLILLIQLYPSFASVDVGVVSV